MKTLQCTVLPKCNFCDKDAFYDAPTSNFGQWGYMCASCAQIHSSPSKLSIGTKFEIRKIKPKQHDSSKALMGIEPDSLDYWQEANDAGYRTIICPTCQGERNLELDADGSFKCEFCGQKVMVPPGLLC